MSDRGSAAVATRPGARSLGERGVETVEALPSGIRQLLVDVGAISQLLVRLVMEVVRNPRGFWVDTIDETIVMLRFSWLPVFLSDAGFSFAIGSFAYDLLRVAGAPNRVATFFVMAGPREISPFTVAMSLAGVMGTSLTADLGARKMREELDALEVLGVNVERALVLPRVIAMTLLMVGLNLIGIVFSVVMPGVVTCLIGNTSVGSYMANFFSIMDMPDLIGTVLKSILLGVFIGVVCAQKGLSAKGGAEGVGRAVNQAVVLNFAAIWVINFTF
ncbi:MAG TPA: ABC transporter permease, partial [Pseudonocardia sp.]